MKYRHKQVDVEALIWHGNNVEEMLQFCGEKKAKVQGMDGHKCLYILTVDGNKFVDYGDYVVKDKKSRLFGVNKYVFNECYDLIKEEK